MPIDKIKKKDKKTIKSGEDTKFKQSSSKIDVQQNKRNGINTKIKSGSIKKVQTGLNLSPENKSSKIGKFQNEKKNVETSKINTDKNRMGFSSKMGSAELTANTKLNIMEQSLLEEDIKDDSIYLGRRLNNSSSKKSTRIRFNSPTNPIEELFPEQKSAVTQQPLIPISKYTDGISKG